MLYNIKSRLSFGVRFFQWIQDRIAPNSLRANCCWCLKRFVAHSDSIREDYVMVSQGNAPRSFISPEEREEMQRVFRWLGHDDDTINALIDAEPGDLVKTGARPWCDDCLRDYFVDPPTAKNHSR